MKLKIMICILLASLLVLTSCGPHAKNPDVINLNESCNIYNGDDLLAIVSYDDFNSENIMGQTDSVLIIETLTIAPIGSIKLQKNDFLLEIWYEDYSNIEEGYKTSIEYNIEKNKYDIFEQEISDKITYHFCFIVPKEKNGSKYNEVGISLLIFHKITLLRMPTN